MKAKAEPNRAYYFELTADGGNIGAIYLSSGDYAGGRAYEDGKPLEVDLAFETYVHTTWDRDKTYQEAFNQFNLDYPPLAKVKAAVEARDWEKAAKELVAHFEGRTDLIKPAEERKVKNIDPKYDRSYADLITTQCVKDAEGNIVSLGPNWNHLRYSPILGGVGLSRAGIRKDLALAYRQTGDENYAVAWNDMLKAGSDEFARKDFLWVATGGKEGTRPSKTSFEYPYSNYYVMRSDWSPEAQYLCLKNGPYTAHGHRDSLGFVMYALGNPVFIDPGIYIYGTPTSKRLSDTRSHSTVSVDGKTLTNAGGPNLFFSGGAADWLIAKGPAYEGLPDSIRTTRRIVFVKPDYWVFSDVIEGKGEHLIESRYHYANTKAALPPKSKTAVTTYETGGNLAVIPVNPTNLQCELEDADVAYGREKMVPAKILKQSARVRLPYRIDNVMYPFKGPSPDTKVKLAYGKGELSAIEVKTAKGTDVCLFTEGPNGFVVGSDMTFWGQGAVVRFDKSGNLRAFSWVWGRGLGGPDALVSASDRPIPGLDVVYDRDVIRVTIRGSDPSLRIATQGRKKASLNGGKPIGILGKGGMFAPFPGKGKPHK